MDEWLLRFLADYARADVSFRRVEEFGGCGTAIVVFPGHRVVIILERTYRKGLKYIPDPSPDEIEIARRGGDLWKLWNSNRSIWLSCGVIEGPVEWSIPARPREPLFMRGFKVTSTRVVDRGALQSFCARSGLDVVEEEGDEPRDATIIRPGSEPSAQDQDDVVAWLRFKGHDPFAGPVEDVEVTDWTARGAIDDAVAEVRRKRPAR